MYFDDQYFNEYYEQREDAMQEEAFSEFLDLSGIKPPLEVVTTLEEIQGTLKLFGVNKFLYKHCLIIYN